DARFTDFGGWTMPVQYRGVLEEHAAVRERVGVFDVSHLGRFEVVGSGAIEVLRSQLCNDITKITPGRAQYTMALNDRGGVEDDIIVWWLDDDRFWVMPNGTNSDDILARFVAAARGRASITDVRTDTALVAVQGPDAPEMVERVCGAVPGRFRVITGAVEGRPVTLAGTGYTGERGAEICVDAADAEKVWDAFVAAGAVPAGLGARDTLRLEMGYPLWGQDLTEDISPVEAGLGWVVAWEHDFVGKDALTAIAAAPPAELIAFATEGRTIPRHGYAMNSSTATGVVTSGNFSPTLGHGIGLALMSPPPSPDDVYHVTIRGTEVPATRVTLPFIDR
ncbi:MAG: glycine cleavage system aminomethyltransferase GcvT, partial [Acidimicrobiia bacterium]|nr:glycine cleavage system aminomethyltransferase GcvT [Acidimicrobiia bacterium]